MNKRQLKHKFAKANNFRLIDEDKRLKIDWNDNFFGEVIEEWCPEVYPYLNRVNDYFEKSNFSYIECLFFILEYFECLHNTGSFNMAIGDDDCIKEAGVSVYLSIKESLRYFSAWAKNIEDGKIPVILKQEINRVKNLYEKEQPFNQIQLVA